MPMISRDDLRDLEDLLDRVHVPKLFEALAAVAGQKEAHVIEAWGDAELARRWSRLGAKFLKLSESIDDPYSE